MELGLVCSNQVYLGTEVVSQYGHQGGGSGVGVGIQDTAELQAEQVHSCVPRRPRATDRHCATR